MTTDLQRAVQTVLDNWDEGDLAEATNDMRIALYAEQDADIEKLKKVTIGFNEYFKDWCKNEGKTLYSEPENMRDQMEEFWMAARMAQNKPLVLITTGLEDNSYQFPADSVDIVKIDWNAIDNGECPYCLANNQNQDWSVDSVCIECGFDTELNDDQAWEWVKEKNTSKESKQ